jgi:hypothetical protein
MQNTAKTIHKPTKLKVGSKIKFKEEKQRYSIMATNSSFTICTKPMNALKTVLYTIIDWNKGIRGTENLIFGMGAETKEQCKNMLERLTEGSSEVSHRNFIGLNIEEYRE